MQDDKDLVRELERLLDATKLPVDPIQHVIDQEKKLRAASTPIIDRVDQWMKLQDRINKRLGL